ncbi:MAG: glycosyltransferase family 1 protein [Aquabacterium commune]|uniref:glycosyltransferase family 4 protein n=1 Tax=Aquabacterium commune TaxID=70586 RepID=UPI003BB0654C
MKIFFDASELTPSSAKSVGIYRYALGLFSALLKQRAVDDELVLVCNGDNERDFNAACPGGDFTVVRVRQRMPGHLWRQWWMRLGCALQVRQHDADVYLSPKGFVPRGLAWPRRARRVAVLHDLIPFWYFRHAPGYFGQLETWLVSDAFEHAFRKADRLVAISQETAHALAEHGVPPERVSVVLNGVDPSVEVASRADLPVGVPQRFIFAMASGLPHKNQRGVLAAYARYRSLVGGEPLPLILCGASDVQQAGVLSVGRVSDRALRALYQYADLFVFLSLIEGFGYPPIEALRVGTQTLCSELGVLREVTGGLARHVDAGSAEQAGLAMHELCASPWSSNQREFLSREALGRIERHLSWERCANGVWRVLRSDATSSDRLKVG